MQDITYNEKEKAQKEETIIEIEPLTTQLAIQELCPKRKNV
ncbi:23759_t:CDS:1, partial [Racocetra persica]